MGNNRQQTQYYTAVALAESSGSKLLLYLYCCTYDTCVLKRSLVFPKDDGGKAACTAGSKSNESSFHASSISRMKVVERRFAFRWTAVERGASAVLSAKAQNAVRWTLLPRGGSQKLHWYVSYRSIVLEIKLNCGAPGTFFIFLTWTSRPGKIRKILRRDAQFPPGYPFTHCRESKEKEENED